MKSRFVLPNDNREMINREMINDILVKIFNQILDIEEQYMQFHNVTDLSLSEIHILDAIATMVQPAMSDIAQKSMLTNGTITTAIKRLETKKYVERYKDENDRRINRVRLTSKGLKAAQTYSKFHEEMTSAICAQNDLIENEELLQGLEKLSNFFITVKQQY